MVMVYDCMALSQLLSGLVRMLALDESSLYRRVEDGMCVLTGVGLDESVLKGLRCEGSVSASCMARC